MKKFFYITCGLIILMSSGTVSAQQVVNRALMPAVQQAQVVTTDPQQILQQQQFARQQQLQRQADIAYACDSFMFSHVKNLFEKTAGEVLQSKNFKKVPVFGQDFMYHNFLLETLNQNLGLTGQAYRLKEGDVVWTYEGKPFFIARSVTPNGAEEDVWGLLTMQDETIVDSYKSKLKLAKEKEKYEQKMLATKEWKNEKEKSTPKQRRNGPSGFVQFLSGVGIGATNLLLSGPYIYGNSNWSSSSFVQNTSGGNAVPLMYGGGN